MRGWAAGAGAVLAAENAQLLRPGRRAVAGDGSVNEVHEVEREPLPAGPDNPWKNAFRVKDTLLTSELAARRATDDERADIVELARRTTIHIDEFRATDRAFHTSIARACGNPLLQEVYGKTRGALFDSVGVAPVRHAATDRR